MTNSKIFLVKPTNDIDMLNLAEIESTKKVELTPSEIELLKFSVGLDIAALALIVATLGLLLTKEQLTSNTMFSGPVNYIYWFAIVIMMVIIFYYMIKTILKVMYKVSDLKKGH